MAQRVHVVLEDDIDGSKAAETVAFSLDGVSYEIDLNEEHANQLRDALEPWIGHARRTGGRRGKKSVGGGIDNAAIRAWALDKGLQVSERGRISREVREAYAREH